MKILVTGASGFIGRALCASLAQAGHVVNACSRSAMEERGFVYIPAPELGPDADWTRALSGVGAVVHLAGLAYADGGRAAPDLEAAYRKVNVDGARSLAAAARKAGVGHFIFVSSLHAVAASSDDEITLETPCRPVSAYGRSKLAAERAIQKELKGSSCAWTFVRPPLVYGRGNTANFGLLLKLVKTGLPLPLASIRNRRSFLYIENLVDLIAALLGNPRAFGAVFMPSDGKNMSTPDLISAIARASSSVEEDRRGKMGDGSSARHLAPADRCFPRLFPFPESLLSAMGRVPGLGALRKLTSSLYVDSEMLRRHLGWTPPFTMDESLKRAMGKTD